MSNIQTKYFEEDGQMVIVRSEDVTAVMESCKARHNQGVHGHKETRHLAQIPGSVVERYCATRGVPYREFVRNPEHMKNILNDRSLSVYRIYPGKV